MTLTSHGPFCDVGDHYVLWDEFSMFDANGMKRLVVCVKCRPALDAAIAAQDPLKLPEGPLRRAYASAMVSAGDAPASTEGQQ